MLTPTASGSLLKDIQRFSRRIGNDPLLIQGAGGNTSLKTADKIWVKASGKWLSEAQTEDIFVPLSLKTGREFLDQRADDFSAAVLPDCPEGLRPSIETSLHIALKQRVVVHVHCVNTLAWAIRRDGKELINERLQGLKWCWIPYRQPGIELAHEILSQGESSSDIFVLANHGLIVAAETVPEAEKLLSKVTGRLAIAPRPIYRPDLTDLRNLADKLGLALPIHGEVHTIACDPKSLAAATSGSLYPDHVVFLGRGLPVADQTRQLSVENAAIAFPGRGVLTRRELSRGGEEMLLCLANVCRRIDTVTLIKTLSADQEEKLMNWEAEKFRQIVQ